MIRLKSILPACLLAALLNSAFGSTPTAKEQMLRTVAARVVAPGYQRLAMRCEQLVEAAQRLEERPDAIRLKQAQESWLEAAIAAQELDCFRIGPIADAGDAATFYFLPARPASIERAIADSAISSQAELKRLGAAAKGLCAMEYLLFPTESANLALLNSEATRRRHYLTLIAREAAATAASLSTAWQEPLQGSAASFINGGQESLNALVNQMAMTTGSITALRLPPLMNSALKAESGKIPGERSNHTRELLLAAARGLQRFHAEGMGNYTRRINAPLADRLTKHYESTLTSIAGLARLPADQPLDSRQAAECFEYCNALDVLFKVDLASSLGVTLTFISTDGD